MDSKRSDDDFNRKIGKRLAALRQSCSMNQAQAAELLGITQSGLSQYENGQRTISCSVACGLMRIYGASYEDIFGPQDPDAAFTGKDADKADELLTLLAESTGNEEISSAVEAYRILAAYRMLRALYECNPHNSGSVFSTDSKEAALLTERLLADEPSRVSSAVMTSSKINRSRIELPVERSAELRSFIERCEAFIEKFGNGQ